MDRKGVVTLLLAIFVLGTAFAGIFSTHYTIQLCSISFTALIFWALATR